MMRLLLDTHAFLWWVDDAPQLSRRARAAIANAENECLVSLASFWEMAIKASLGKLDLPAPMERFIPEQLAVNRFQRLDIDFRHVVRTAAMPFHHRDPFDRLLAAQALEEDLTLVSGDPVFRKYKVRRLW
jgi:PIN domain nuclease of toxin-antitoxin system